MVNIDFPVSVFLHTFSLLPINNYDRVISVFVVRVSERKRYYSRNVALFGKQSAELIQLIV